MQKEHAGCCIDDRWKQDQKAPFRDSACGDERSGQDVYPVCPPCMQACIQGYLAHKKQPPPLQPPLGPVPSPAVGS